MEEFEQVYFVNSDLEDGDKTSSKFVIEHNVEVSDKTNENNANVCIKNPNFNLNEDNCSNLSQKDYAVKSQFLKPGKYIMMKEDGSVEIIDREGGDADLIAGNYVSETIEPKTELMEQDGQECVNEIFQSDLKISGKDPGCETTDTGESDEEHQAVNPNFCAKENITIVHVKNKEKNSTKIVKVVVDKGLPSVQKINIKPANKLTCEYCKKIFTRLPNKNRHLKKVHNVQFSVDEEPGEKLTCEYCNKNFTKISNKYRHLKIVHKVQNPVDGDIRCLECNIVFRRIQQLRDHLQSDHGLKMLSEELHFPNMNAFKKWKCEIERKLLCSYTLKHGSKTNPLGPKYFYSCHRSGRYQPKTTGIRKRMIRAGGSCKLGIICTSAIYCQNSPNDVIVNYYPNHYGHGKETMFVQLSPEEQMAIQETVSNGVSFEKLLDDIRDNQSKDPFQLLLLKKRDFRWINSAFNSEEVNPGISDAESVENWVRSCCEMEDSPVLFYHQKDIGSDQEEFILVIMTEFQKHILFSSKRNVVCVDSLYQRKGGRFYLTILFVMDEFDNAFPVALCISNKVDKNVIEQFFFSIKDSAGILSFKYFMSDQESFFYESWVNVMNDKPRWLWSIWYVDHKIRTQLKMFKGNVAKRAEVYKTMRQLLACQNEMVFQCMFKNFIDNLSSNPLTKNFGKFIINKYGSNAEMWAACYRQEVDLSTNSYLDIMHRTFRYCCREGRKKRLDKFLFVVMKLVKCKMLDRISNMLDEEKLNLAIEAIHMCHSAGLDIPAKNMSALSEKIWLVQTGDEERPLYVTKELEKCPEHCNLRCNDCDICVHQYSCTCVHSMVDANLCIHIHAVVWKFLTPHFSPIPSPTHSPGGFDNDIVVNFESEASSSKCPDLLDNVLKRTHDVYKNVKQNRCNLNKESLEWIMKRLDECVDKCVGKTSEVSDPLTATSETPNNAAFILNSYVKGGPNQPFILPHPIQTPNNGVATQYVLLMPTNGHIT